MVRQHLRVGRGQAAVLAAAATLALVGLTACGGSSSTPAPTTSPPTAVMPGTQPTGMPGTMPGTSPGAAKVMVAQGGGKLSGPALATALRTGGYVIALRHGATDNTRSDANVNLSDCNTQRPLTATGVAQAQQVGAAVRTLRLPIGNVLYSPYCRTRTTAQLEFGNTGQPDMDLVAADYHGVNQSQQDPAVLKLLNTVPKAGTDTALVTHQNTLQNATGIPTPAEGGAEIYRPQPTAAPLLVAELSPADWTALARGD